MKNFIIMVVVALVSCTGQQTAAQHGITADHHHDDKAKAIPLNNGAKWKADESTKRNVAAMMQVVNDSTYTDPSKRKQLYDELKSKVDTMVKECRMTGPDHDALHMWLERVLKGMKELREDDEDEAYDDLKKDIASFYQSFE